VIHIKHKHPKYFCKICGEHFYNVLEFRKHECMKNQNKKVIVHVIDDMNIEFKQKIKPQIKQLEPQTISS